MAHLYDILKQASGSAFKFLVDDYGFQIRDGTNHFPELAVHFIKNEISITAFVDDAIYITILIHKLHGQENTLDWESTIPIEKLERLRCPDSSQLTRKERGNWSDGKGIERILKHDAGVIKCFFPEYLIGKWIDFPVRSKNSTSNE